VAPPSYRQLLSDNANYRRLWFGELVSFLGDWFSTIALYEVVGALTDSAFAITAVLVARTLPVFLMVPIAGPLVDRLERRRLMVWTDLARSVLVLAIIGAWQVGSVPLVLALLTLKMCFSGVFIPARSAVVPQLVTDDELPVAMALSSGTWSVMLALGAAAGGVVTAWLGIAGALVLDAFTFLWSAWLLWGLPDLHPTGGSRESTGFVEGVAYLVRAPHVTALAACKTAMALASGGIAMLPLFGDGAFEATSGPLWVGVLYACRGMGAFAGTIGMRRLTGDAPDTLRRWLFGGFGVLGVGTAALAYAPDIFAVAACFFFAAVGNGIIWVYSGTLLQLETDAQYRGRVFAIDFGVMTLGVSAVAAVSGGLVDWGGWDIRDVVLASAAAVLLVGFSTSAAVLATVPKREIRATGGVPPR
jgi:MFS family permease